MKANAFVALTVLAAVSVPPAALAQTLVLDTGIMPAAGGPPRGTTMAEVERRHGAPASRSGPVGDPPITVWRYEGFSVYFEGERVLHSTAKK